MLSIGNVEITRIEEVVLNEPTTLFADWNDSVIEQQRDLMIPHCFNVKDHVFYASIHSYLIKTLGQTILIDTCGGNDKPRPASPRFHMLNIPWLDRLKAAGATPDDIDTVICTHLHVDHVGWNTRLVDGEWVPTFPKAKYVFPRIEVEWRDPKRGAVDKPPATHHVFLDSVLPILEAGKAQLVEGTERWTDEVDFMPTPGHAPGQMAVRLRTGGEEVVFTADVMHQPVQVFNPTWSSKYCEDPILATATRRRMFDYFADNKCLVFPAHFGFPHGGYISRRDGGYDFKPLGRDINPA